MRGGRWASCAKYAGRGEVGELGKPATCGFKFSVFVCGAAARYNAAWVNGEVGTQLQHHTSRSFLLMFGPVLFEES